MAAVGAAGGMGQEEAASAATLVQGLLPSPLLPFFDASFIRSHSLYGEFVYRLTDWVSPALEYYGDMGPISPLPGVQRQQHFVVPTLNFDFLPQLELNLGVGVGVTRTSNGLFLKSIVGWTF